MDGKTLHPPQHYFLVWKEYAVERMIVSTRPIVIQEHVDYKEGPHVFRFASLEEAEFYVQHYNEAFGNNQQPQQQEENMKSLIILAYAHINNGALYTLIPQGEPKSGYYRSNIDENDVKTEMEFICNGMFRVHQVKRQNAPARIFTLGDPIVTPGGVSKIIQICLVNNASYFVTNNNRKILVSLTEVPAPQPAAPPKAAQPAAGGNGKNFTDLQFNDLGKKIEATYPRAIRLENTLKKTVAALGLQGFLKIFFTEWNKEKKTIYADGAKEMQTDVAKRRSIGDIYMLAKYYFPDASLKEVYRMLTFVLPKEIKAGFRTSACRMINKRVWYYDPKQENAQINTNEVDEHGSAWQKICFSA